MKYNILNLLLSILISQVAFSCKAPERRNSNIHKLDSMVMNPDAQKAIKTNKVKTDNKNLQSLITNYNSAIDTIFGKRHVRCYVVNDESNIVKFYYHNNNKSDTTYYKGIKLRMEVRDGEKSYTKTITRKELGTLVHIKALNTFYILLLDATSKDNKICCNFRLSEVDADDQTYYFQCYFEKGMFRLKYIGTESYFYF